MNIAFVLQSIISKGEVYVMTNIRRLLWDIPMQYPTLVTAQEHEIILRIRFVEILIQTSAMVSVVSLRFADFRPVFRVIVSNTAHRR